MTLRVCMSWPIPQCSSKNAEGSGHTEKAYWLPAEVRSSAVCDPRTIWVQLSFTEKDLIKKCESMQQSQGSKRKEKNTSEIFQTVIVGRSGVRDIKYWPKKLGNLKEKRNKENLKYKLKNSISQLEAWPAFALDGKGLGDDSSGSWAYHLAYY